MPSFIHHIGEFVYICIEMLFPELCFGCGNKRGYPCEMCYEKIVPLIRQYCPYCRLKSLNGSVCADCRGKKRLLRGLYICADYKESQVLQRAIHACKYKKKRRLMEVISGRLGSFIDARGLLAGMGEVSSWSCVPVPLARERLRERGFNQAEDLARIIASQLSLPLVTTVLRRRRNTPPQAKLRRRERLQNMQGAFHCLSPPPKRVLLIDDVATTLATLESCAQALLDSGTQSVYGLVLARSGRAR